MDQWANRRSYVAFVSLFGSAITSQALLSAASLVVGLILIRRTTDLQYGYYILASGALILLSSLQNAFFNPALAIRISRLDQAGRRALIGGLFREQRRIATALGAIAAVTATILWFAGVLDTVTGPLVLATVAAAIVVLNREYFRMVLLARRRAYDVLRTDALYVLLLVAGVFLATMTSAPATTALFMLGLAAVGSGILLARTLRRVESWDALGVPGILRDIAPLAAWSTTGAALHWTFSQGYAYLVAGTLDLTAVAAIAATRLTVMPVNMLSSGIGMLMLPLVSRWLHEHGTSRVLRRLMTLAAALVGASLCYFTVVWLLRDWIFSTLLHKEFEQRDQLLMLWSATFLIIVVRDQLTHFVAARGLFRPLTFLVLLSAALSLTASYWGMLWLGAEGALLGVMIGEAINLGGIVMLSFYEARHPFSAPVLAEAAQP